jgi:hypothetical protein
MIYMIYKYEDYESSPSANQQSLVRLEVEHFVFLVLVASLEV